MAYERLGGIARVTTDPNTILELQSGHTIQKAKLVSDGTEWTYIASNLAGSKWVLDVLGVQDETEVPLVNTYSNIKKIDTVQVLEGDVNIDYTPGYFYAENYIGNLDPNSELFNLQVGDTIYFEGLDGNIGSVVIDDYVYADPINLELEFASQTPALILDHNGNPISDSDPNWSDDTFTNLFNVYIESPVESPATTVADALSYLDNFRIPNFNNGLIFNEANGEAEIGGDFNKETTINTNNYGFNLIGTNSAYNFNESFAGMNVNGFINFQSLVSGFTLNGLGGQGNVIGQGLNLQSDSSSVPLTLNSQNDTIISAQGNIILNKNGNTPAIGDVWTAIGTGGQGQWQTPSGGNSSSVSASEGLSIDTSSGDVVLGGNPLTSTVGIDLQSNGLVLFSSTDAITPLTVTPNFIGLNSKSAVVVTSGTTFNVQSQTTMGLTSGDTLSLSALNNIEALSTNGNVTLKADSGEAVLEASTIRLKKGTTNSAIGQVWTATDVNGGGEWANASGGGAISGRFTPIALDTNTPLTVDSSSGYFMKVGRVFSFTMTIEMGVQTGSGLFRIGGLPYEYPSSGVLDQDLSVSGILEGTGFSNLASLVWKLEDYGNIIPSHDGNADGTYTSLTPSDVSGGKIMITGVAVVQANAAINPAANVVIL